MLISFVSVMIAAIFAAAGVFIMAIFAVVANNGITKEFVLRNADLDDESRAFMEEHYALVVNGIGTVFSAIPLGIAYVVLI